MCTHKIIHDNRNRIFQWVDNLTHQLLYLVPTECTTCLWHFEFHNYVNSFIGVQLQHIILRYILLLQISFLNKKYNIKASSIPKCGHLQSCTQWRICNLPIRFELHLPTAILMFYIVHQLYLIFSVKMHHLIHWIVSN